MKKDSTTPFPIACALGCALAAATALADGKPELHAYVQSHNFDLRPLMPPRRGYAFFVDSSSFSGFTITWKPPRSSDSYSTVTTDPTM